MTVEELLEELRQMPLTAMVTFANTSRGGRYGFDRVMYTGGQAVILLDGDEDDAE